MKYRVIIVDDSTYYRDFLKTIINSFEDFEVCDVAKDAYEARDKIKLQDPDLVTIDINMPKMDGIVFLKNLMRLHPMPSFVISDFIDRNKEVYEDGALGFIQKKQDSETVEEFAKRLKNMLFSFTYLYDRYKNSKNSKIIEQKVEPKYHPDILLPKKPALKSLKKVIAIGSSTGGVEALLEIFSQLPNTLPPIVIVQHIPFGFSKNLANRLDRCSKLSVFEVDKEMELLNGCAYLAIGNQHIIVDRDNLRRYVVKTLDGEKICYQKPSVNILFRSVNNTFGASTTAIILTGMGDDGAICMKELYDNGAYTIAQDEKSSTVFGMPKKAIETGGVKEILPLNSIAKRIVELN